MNVKRLFLVALAGIFSIFLSGCYTVPVTGRSALSMMPEAEVAGMSAQAFQEMKNTTPRSNDAVKTAMLQRVGPRIADAVKEDIPDAEWEFVLFEDPSANAFAMSGGKVGVFTGLFQIIEKDEDLAVVLGHEIAHVSARHVNERMSQQVMMQMGAAAVGIGAQQAGASQATQQILSQVYGVGMTVGVALPFNRGQESEADQIGLLYMARAGYDPRAAVPFWERMSTLGEGSAPPEFMSTHPSHETRVNQLQQLMPGAVAEYEYYKDKRWLDQNAPK